MRRAAGGAGGAARATAGMEAWDMKQGSEMREEQEPKETVILNSVAASTSARENSCERAKSKPGKNTPERKGNRKGNEKSPDRKQGRGMAAGPRLAPVDPPHPLCAPASRAHSASRPFPLQHAAPDPVPRLPTGSVHAKRAKGEGGGDEGAGGDGAVQTRTYAFKRLLPALRRSGGSRRREYMRRKANA